MKEKQRWRKREKEEKRRKGRKKERIDTKGGKKGGDTLTRKASKNVNT